MYGRIVCIIFNLGASVVRSVNLTASLTTLAWVCHAIYSWSLKVSRLLHKGRWFYLSICDICQGVPPSISLRSIGDVSQGSFHRAAQFIHSWQIGGLFSIGWLSVIIWKAWSRTIMGSMSVKCHAPYMLKPLCRFRKGVWDFCSC